MFFCLLSIKLSIIGSLQLGAFVSADILFTVVTVYACGETFLDTSANYCFNVSGVCVFSNVKSFATTLLLCK